MGIVDKMRTNKGAPEDKTVSSERKRLKELGEEFMKGKEERLKELVEILKDGKPMNRQQLTLYSDVCFLGQDYLVSKIPLVKLRYFVSENVMYEKPEVKDWEELSGASGTQLKTEASRFVTSMIREADFTPMNNLVLVEDHKRSLIATADAINSSLSSKNIND